MASDAEQRRWFREVVHAVRERVELARGSDEVWAVTTDGWFASIGRVRGDSSFAVVLYFDRYLDARGPRRISVWLRSSSARAVRDVAARSSWKEPVSYRWRDRRAQTLAARPGQRILGRPIVDIGWDEGTFYGRYLPLDNPLIVAPEDAVRAIARDVNHLVKLVSRKTVAPDLPDPPAGVFANAPPDRLVERSIWERRGQPAFRNKLKKHFRGCCAISGCDVPILLEAAHIEPYARGGAYSVDNGLLLRADLHLLFDTGMIRIDCERGRAVVRIDPSLRGTDYDELEGKSVPRLRRGQLAALQRRASVKYRAAR